MKYWQLLLLIIWGTLIKGQNIQISGIVSDDNGPLSYVSVYVKGTSIATLSNDLGFYTLEVEPNSQIVFQYLGYETVIVSIANEDRELHVTMEQELFAIEEIEVLADKEDPAYAIIREAIRNKRQYRLNKQTYEADLYVKGVVKIVDAPTTFMGVEVGDLNGIIDSNKQGILYLSETQSDIFRNKEKTKEILKSSILAGEDNDIGFNQFMFPHIDFYEDNIRLMRDMISPLSDNALTFYRYKLEQATVDGDGHLIYKIKVIPKDKYRPCFEGQLSIIDGSFRIHSLDLNATKHALNSQTFSAFGVKQVFSEIKRDDWRLLTQTINFKINFLAFKTEGYFNSVFSNYILNRHFEDGFFNFITFEAKEESIINDTSFWNAERPIALTAEEKSDYKRKDSLKRYWNSDTYLDSIDRENNRFEFSKLLTGYTYRNSKKKTSFGINSPILNTNFNAVEGLNFALKPFYTFSGTEGGSSYRIGADVRYGFQDNAIKPYVYFRKTISEKNRTRLSFGAGRVLMDFSKGSEIMTEFWNSFHSLYYKLNFLRIYQRDRAFVNYSSEIANGLQFMVEADFSRRKKLDNNSNFSFRRLEDEYAPNNPFDLPVSDLNLSPYKASVKLSFRWVPGQKVMIYPNSKVRLPSNYPTIKFDMEHAFKVNDDYSGFNKISLNISDDYLSAGILGHACYNLRVGTFLMKGADFPDYFHFAGQEVYPRAIDRYNNSFRLLPFYLNDSEDDFVATFFEQHLDGLIMDKIPGLKKLGWTFVLTANSLIQPDLQYLEPGIGIESIKIAGINALRLDYFWGFDQTGLRNRGIRIGFVNVMNGVFL